MFARRATAQAPHTQHKHNTNTQTQHNNDTRTCALSVSTNCTPSLPFWYSVSSNMMAPLMYCPSPGAVYSSWRHARRLSSVFSTPTDSRRLPVLFVFWFVWLF